MLIVCPCLNVKINCNQIYSNADYVSFVDLIKNEAEFCYDASKCIVLIDNNNSNDDTTVKKYLNVEYKQLIGYIKRTNYCMFKCCSCNIYTHILFDRTNKLIVSSNMLIKNNENELESMKNDENYSKIFNIIINKNNVLTTTTDILKNKDIKTNIDDINEYKSLSKHIENVANSYLNNEKEKYLTQVEEYKLEKENNYNCLKTKINNEINQFNKIIKYISSSFNSSIGLNMMMNNAALSSTTTTTTKPTNNGGIHENTTSQESIESGYIEDNSNSSIISDISTASIHNTNTNATSSTKTTTTTTTRGTINNNNNNNNNINRMRTWSENNKNEINKRSNTQINQKIINNNNNNNNDDDDNNVFCFEDSDDINYSSNHQSDFNNFIDDDDANDGDLMDVKPTPQQQQTKYDNRILNNNESMDYQNKYSCSCPRTIPTMSLRSRNIQDNDFIDDNEQHQLDEQQRSNDDNDNLGRAFAQLASSIVQKDGTELFGDRPSRRIPINSISKSCYDS